MGLSEILLFAFILLPLLFVVIAIVDVIKRNFYSPHIKLMLVLIILFIPVIGFVIYFLVGSKSKSWVRVVYDVCCSFQAALVKNGKRGAKKWNTGRK